MLIFSFTGTQIGVSAGLALLLLMASIFLLRYRMRRARPSANDHRTKLAGADAFRQRPLVLKVGFVLALGSSFLAINWTEYSPRPDFSLGTVVFDADLEQVPPRTMERPLPPPPPPPPPIIEPVPEEEAPKPLTFASQDIVAAEAVSPSSLPPAAVPAPPVLPPPPPEAIVDPFIIVEEMPTFGVDCVDLSDKEARRQCSDRAILSYFAKNLNYPALARENGIEGAVVLRFVVEKDGSVSDIETLRDPGAGLGAEARRVLEAMNATQRWEPGKQRGRPVRVYFNLPIRFQLE